MTEEEVLRIREALIVSIASRAICGASSDEHQAADGYRLLSRPAAPQGMPVRGQRTRTNARTRKGKPKPIAGKKK